MKAVVATSYGSPSVLKIVKFDAPEPEKNEIVVKVKATAVTAGDARVRALRVPAGFGLMVRMMFGLFKPNGVLGGSFSGTVIGVGAGVSKFKVGDKVFGFKKLGRGAHAEYLTIGEDEAVTKAPSELKLEEAAALPFGGDTALFFLRDLGKVQKGYRVLVNGASGEVGVAAVQLATSFGAVVYGVCSQKNHKLVKSLGAKFLIDYKQTSPEKINEKFDLIFDTVGSLDYEKMKSKLTQNGRFISTVAGVGEFIKFGLKSLSGWDKYFTGTAEPTQKNLEYLGKLVKKGKFKPVIGKRFGFSEIIKAHEYVDSKHKTGSALVIVD